MNHRENVLRTIRFEKPERIPTHFGVNNACWHHYDQTALQDLMEAHTMLFPGFKRRAEVKPVYQVNGRKDEPYTDPWQCVWQTADDGITGSVHGHPLADWSAFENFTAPDWEKTDGISLIDWKKIGADVARQKAAGELVEAGLPHGHTFLRLQDLRGYENLIFDMMDEEPRLFKLIDMVEEFNYGYVMKWMALEPDIFGCPEDLGMQVGPMLSPDAFVKYIKPVYKRLMKPARDQGCIVHMHSDGDIRTLVDDLIDGGVEIINLQDLVNGIDWIAAKFAGKICVDLDVDRQKITARGTPQQIDALIREEVEKIGSKEGGLMLVFGLYPGTPLANVKAVMDAMENYATYYA